MFNQTSIFYILNICQDYKRLTSYKKWNQFIRKQTREESEPCFGLPVQNIYIYCKIIFSYVYLEK